MSLDGPDGREALPTSAPPTGRAVRALTRGAARARTGAGWGTVLGDVYSLVLSTAVGLAMAMSGAERLAESWRPADSGGGASALLDPAWIAVLGTAGVLGALLSLSVRLGPVALGSPQAAWWLPLPVDRRSLLRPAAVRWPVVAAVLGGLAAAVLAVLGLRRPTVGGVLEGAGVVALVAALVSIAAGLAQTGRSPRRALTAAGDGVVAATPVLGLLLVLLHPQPPGGAGPAFGVLVATGVLAGSGAVLLDLRLGRIRDAELRERGAVAGRALGAAVSLDSRELGRALSEVSRRQRRRRSRHLGGVGGPGAAVVASDALLLARSPRHQVQVVVAACLPVAALFAGAPAPAVVAVALVLGGILAMLATAEGARRAEMVPALDSVLPLSAVAVRRWRAVVPGVVMAGWSLAVFCVLALRRDDPAWLELGLASAPVWAGAAVRGAYRPRPDWSGVLVATPAGALPPGAAGVIARGPDTVVLGLVPVFVALALEAVAPALVVLQLVLSAIVLAVGTRVPAKRPGP